MTETRAALLGFGAVALAMVGVAVWLFASTWWVAAHSRQMESRVDGPIGKMFLQTDLAGGSPITTRQISQISDVLPSGMPGQEALDRLSADHFDCRTARDLITCERSHPSGVCNFHWRVFLIFRGDRFVSSTSADSRADCL